MYLSNRKSLVVSVTQATGTMEFEDGLGPGGNVVVLGTLLSDQIPILLSSTHRWC